MLQPNYRFLSTGDLKNLPDDKQYIKNILKSVEKITEEGPYFSNGLAPSVNKGEPSILQYIADAFSNREYEVLVQELHHVDGKWTFSSSVSFLSKIRKDHKETLEAQCVFEVVNGKPSALQYLTIKKLSTKKKKKGFFMKKRDKMIIAAFERSINLNVRIVRSKKEFNRKRLKQEIKKDWLTPLS